MFVPAVVCNHLSSSSFCVFRTFLSICSSLSLSFTVFRSLSPCCTPSLELFRVLRCLRTLETHPPRRKELEDCLRALAGRATISSVKIKKKPRVDGEEKTQLHLKPSPLRKRLPVLWATDRFPLPAFWATGWIPLAGRMDPTRRFPVYADGGRTETQRKTGGG